jgi:hypothetical protein
LGGVDDGELTGEGGGTGVGGGLASGAGAGEDGLLLEAGDTHGLHPGANQRDEEEEAQGLLFGGGRHAPP